MQGDLPIRPMTNPDGSDAFPLTSELLLRSEDRLRDVIEGAQVGTWTWDFDTVHQVVNDVWAGMLGYELQELQPVTYDTWERLLHPDDAPMVAAEIGRCIRDEGDFYEAEYRLRHRAGHWIWVLDRGRVVRRHSDGAPKLMAGIQIEISELKSREAALVKAKQELESALALRDSAERRFADVIAVNEGWFWEMDADLRWSHLSHTESMEVVGLTRTEWLNLHPDTRASADWSLVLDAQRDRRAFRDFVYRAPAGPEGERWFRISGTPVHDTAGNFLGYRGVGADVTQLYLAKARAEEASRTKSKFLANMSHEIRTPLNGVLGMAEVLENALTDPEQRRMIGTIRESGATLLTILNDILDMSKIEAGKMELERVAFSPADVLERVEDLHRLKAEEKGLQFEVLLSSGSGTMRIGDPLRVQQVLHNLVSNAIKFTDSGRVEVRMAGKAGKALTLEVRDTGIGMSPEQIARLHDEFSQADSSVTRRFGGTGLGMAITRDLVLRMGGHISVQSAPGQGSLFRVSLPLDMSNAAPAPEPAAQKQTMGDMPLNGLRVLVADDNGTNRTVLDLMLRRSGATVKLVEDGRAAVDQWQAGGFDVVLLDIAMPVMDGTAALAEIRRIEAVEALPRIPVVAVTANAMPDQVAAYLAAGFDQSLSKPVSLADLTRTLRQLCPDDRAVQPQ